MRVTDHAERVADTILETIALSDVADAYEAIVSILRDELAAAKAEGFREANPT
jgi:hypothetical protein